MFKKISLFLIAIISVIALVGCFDLDKVNSIEFVNFPQATYYKVDQNDVAKLNQAYETLLGEITIRINDEEPITLEEAITNGTVTVNFDASILTKTGTKTMVITLGSAKLTYVFNVVEEQLFAEGKGTEDDPYKITTPQQLINIGTRVFGIPVPQSTDETAWKYYYQFSFPYLAGGKHYEIVKDLDFDGVNFTPLGYFGGSNFVPFTGKIIGNVNGNPAKIKNMNFENDNTKVDVCSLFAGANGSTFKDLIFENVNIDTQGKHGAALLSYNGVVGSKDYNVINNVKIESGLIKALRAGGIVCEGNNTFFLNCSNKADIYSFQHCGGGIFGRVTSRSYSYYQHKQKDGGSTLLVEDIKAVTNTDVTETTIRGYIQDCKNEGNIFGYTTDKNNSASGLGTANAAVYYENCSSTGTITSTQITHQLLHGTVYGPDLSNNTMVYANIGTTTLDYTDILDTDECYIEVSAQDGPNLAIALKVSKEAMKVYSKISLMYQQDGTANEQTEQDCLYVDNKWSVYGPNGEEETRYFTLKSLKVEFIVIRKDTQGNVTSVRKASQTLTLIP